MYTIFHKVDGTWETTDWGSYLCDLGRIRKEILAEDLSLRTYSLDLSFAGTEVEASAYSDSSFFDSEVQIVFNSSTLFSGYISEMGRDYNLTKLILREKVKNFESLLFKPEFMNLGSEIQGRKYGTIFSISGSTVIFKKAYATHYIPCWGWNLFHDTKKRSFERREWASDFPSRVSRWNQLYLYGLGIIREDALKADTLFKFSPEFYEGTTGHEKLKNLTAYRLQHGTLTRKIFSDDKGNIIGKGPVDTGSITFGEAPNARAGWAIYFQSPFQVHGNPISIAFNLLTGSLTNFSFGSKDFYEVSLATQALDPLNLEGVLEENDSLLNSLLKPLCQAALIDIFQNEKGEIVFSPLKPLRPQSFSTLYVNDVGDLTFKVSKDHLRTFVNIKGRSLGKTEGFEVSLERKGVIGKSYSLTSDWITDEDTAKNIAQRILNYYGTPLRTLSLKTFGTHFLGSLGKVIFVQLPFATGFFQIREYNLETFRNYQYSYTLIDVTPLTYNFSYFASSTSVFLNCPAEPHYGTVDTSTLAASLEADLIKDRVVINPDWFERPKIGDIFFFEGSKEVFRIREVLDTGTYLVERNFNGCGSLESFLAGQIVFWGSYEYSTSRYATSATCWRFW